MKYPTLSVAELKPFHVSDWIDAQPGWGNTTPEGITASGTTLWVVNSASTDKVFVYTTAGVLQGFWTIGNTTPTGLTIDPSNANQSIWIVDSGTDRVYEYTNARSRLSGSQASATSFLLAPTNTSPQDIADPRSFPVAATSPSSSAPVVPGSARSGESSRTPSAAVVPTSELVSAPALETDSPPRPANPRASASTPHQPTAARGTTRGTTLPAAASSSRLMLDELFAEESWLMRLQNV